MRLVFSTAAQRELFAAVRYYESQRPGLGAEFLAEFDKALEFMRRYPDGSPIKDKNVRQRPMRRFPFALFYAVCSDEIIILSVAHTHRKPQRWETM